MEGKFTPRMRDERGHDHFPTGPGHHRIRLGVQHCVQRHGSAFDRDGKLRSKSLVAHCSIGCGAPIQESSVNASPWSGTPSAPEPRYSSPVVARALRRSSASW